MKLSASIYSAALIIKIGEVPENSVFWSLHIYHTWCYEYYIWKYHHIFYGYHKYS